MALVMVPEKPPLRLDEHGVPRVGGTRVTLDSVVIAFQNGATAEEIAVRYEALRLEDVYLTIGYYLRHRAEVDAYLAGREQLAANMQREADARLSWRALRDRLIARQEAHHPSSGE
jgi:uncharacterized protein (DUF433 family)